MKKKLAVKNFSELGELLADHRIEPITPVRKIITFKKITKTSNVVEPRIPARNITKPQSSKKTPSAIKSSYQNDSAMIPSAFKPRVKKKKLKEMWSEHIFATKNKTQLVAQARKWNCPLCREQVCPSNGNNIDEHYKIFHNELWCKLEKERLNELQMVARKNRVRPVIFLGGSPGGGRRR